MPEEVSEVRDWVERNEPRAELRVLSCEQFDMYCIEFPYNSSTAFFTEERKAWEAARRMIEEEQGL